MVDLIDGAPPAVGAGDAPLVRVVLDALLDPWVLLEPVTDDVGNVLDFRYAAANEAACREQQRSRDEFVGSLMLAGLPEPSRPAVLAAALAAFANPGPTVLDSFPLPWNSAGLADRVYDIRAVRVGHRLSATWRDVTTRVRETSELAASEARHRMLAENASDVVYSTAAHGRITWVSPSVTAVLGWRPEDLVGRAAAELLHPDDHESAAAIHRSLLAGTAEPPAELEVRYATRAGDWRWMGLRARATHDDDGEFDGSVVALRDVEEARRARERLAASEANYRSLAENSSDVILILAPEGTIRWASPSAVVTLGRTPDDLVGADALELVNVEERPLVRARGRTALHGEAIPPTEARYRHAKGDFRWGSFAASLRDGTAGQEWLIALRDIDAEVRARQALATSRELLRGTIDTLIDPWVLMNAVRDGTGTIVDFEYVDANDAACRANGLPREELIGSRLLTLFPQHAPDGLLRLYAEVVETGEPLALDDHPFSSEITGFVERRYDNRAARVGDGISFTWRDVTDRYEAREELTRLARYDMLTGLPNRAYVMEQMRAVLSRRRPDEDPVAILFCDLDHFKSINDAHLHAAGDAVLRAVAARLLASVRPRDVVGRLGGDEFVVVLDGVRDVDEAQSVAERIRASVAQPIPLPDRVLRIRTSVGITLIPGGTDADTALTMSDDAMYRAKSLGRDRAVFLPPSAATEPS